jgi:hypothetical protein
VNSLVAAQWAVINIPKNSYRNKEKEVLGQLLGGSSEGHLGVNKTLDKVSGNIGYTQEATLRGGAHNMPSTHQAEVPEPDAPV